MSPLPPPSVRALANTLHPSARSQTKVVGGPRITKIRFKPDQDAALIVGELEKQAKVLAHAKGQELKGSGLMRRALSRDEPDLLQAFTRETLSDSDDDDDARSVGGRSLTGSTPTLNARSMLSSPGGVQFSLDDSSERSGLKLQSCASTVELLVDVENVLSDSIAITAPGGGEGTSIQPTARVRVLVRLDRIEVGGNSTEHLLEKVALKWCGGGREGTVRLGKKALAEMIQVRARASAGEQNRWRLLFFVRAPGCDLPSHLPASARACFVCAVLRCPDLLLL